MKKNILLFILSITICSKAEPGGAPCNAPSNSWINIFIHGTVGIRSNFNICTFRRLIKDEICGTEYEKNVYRIRQYSPLYTTQPMQELGLKKIDACSAHCGPYTAAILLDDMFKKFQSTTDNSFYTFGWSGLLSFKRRHEEARLFYIELRKEIARLTALGQKPKIRLIGYSHGATLGFNLAAIREFEFPEDAFCIDEIVLLGMPVQHETNRLIDSPIFKKIYHIYSRADAVQRLDIFAPTNLISYRRLRCPSQNVTQIELRVTAKLLKIPGQSLPQGLRGTINQSPGHGELWFFGWTPNDYRNNFTFYPLPALTFVPYLIYASQCLEDKPKHIIVDLRPDQEMAILTNKYDKCKYMIPFMSHEEINALKNIACSLKPELPLSAFKNI